MRTFVQQLRRPRPRIGWPLLVLALATVLSPAMAATDGPLKLPAATFGWAGLLGLLVGLGWPRTADGRSNERPDEPRTKNKPRQYATRNILWLLVAVGLGALLLLGLLGTLPPLGLIAEDVRALFAGLEQLARRLLEIGAPSPPAPALDPEVQVGPPVSRTWLFMEEALPRAWNQLLAAPSSGEQGARLVVAFGGVLTAWVGAIMLGWGLGRQRSLAGWGLPFLAALTFTTTLGGASALPLIGGLALLLLLGIVADARRREAAWEHAEVDFSSELLGDVLLWGGLVAALVVLLAALLPAWLDNPIASALWPEGEVPSGLDGVSFI